jgi:hypothetical protein
MTAPHKQKFVVSFDQEKENKIYYRIMMIDDTFPDEETGLLKKAPQQELHQKGLLPPLAQVPCDQPLLLEKGANSDADQVGLTSSITAYLVYIWISYTSVLQKRPLIVKCITASIILGLGDLVGQATENANAVIPRAIDWTRAFRFAFFGLVFQAPFCHCYFSILDKALPPTSSPLSFSNALKVLIDQLIQSPIFLVLVFYFLGTLEGKSPAKIRQQIKEEYLITLIANCKFTHPQ